MQDEVIVEELPGKNGFIGRLTLNRPQALNALTENMCLQILKALEKWENDSKIKLVIIKGAGEKAFCAGGDIRQVYLHGTNPPSSSGLTGGSNQKMNPANQPFFIAEYAMNKALYHFKKPYFAFLNGITMGGGVGVSIHGSHRIATEKLRLAMPETAIGFYPDVGCGYHLVRCPKKFGWYLALTGNTISANEAVHFGLCTHFVPSAAISDLEKLLISTADDSVLKDFIEDGFLAFPGNDGEGRAGSPAFTKKDSNGASGNLHELLQQENIIEDIFSARSLEEILERLEKNESAFGQNTLETLQLRSPLSLKVTWEHLKHCEQLSFDEVIKENYVMTQQFLKGHDFFEGVRAQIIDKDKNPKWQPAKLSDITNTQVEAYFKNPSP